MNEQVTKYILEAPEEQQKLMMELRALIHSEVPLVTESFKWSRPVFSKGSDFAYFKTTKSYLTFGFFKFGQITDDTHLLQGTGKDMRHIKLRQLKDLQSDLMKKWIKQAIT